MWHKKALERQVDGKPSGIWDFTISWDSGPNKGPRKWGACALEDCGGHPSPEEAYAHQKRYALANNVEDLTLMNWTNCGVFECEEPAKGGYLVKGEMPSIVPLCPQHKTRETLEDIYSVGESWGS